MKTILALETSCDETAVAVLRGTELLASEVTSQIAEHQQYGGVVPEVASRNHVVHAPRLLARAAKSSGVTLGEVDAFAATSGPGLASSLMIGASIAKGLALGFGRPYLAVNHLEGHLLSPFFGAIEIEPNVSLIVSGGHTLLVEVNALGDYHILGRTLDDAAGEAFDKVAKMLGLGYPGGPEIERLARNGDAERYDLPRGMLHSSDHNFSFSGLKTAVRYLLEKLGNEMKRANAVIPSGCEGPHANLEPVERSFTVFAAQDDRVVTDVCASFQAAVIDVLVSKTIAAARAGSREVVTISGGVSCNSALRNRLAAACERAGLRLLTAAPQLCTDNAAMIAFAASLRLRAGYTSDVTEEIDPNLALG